MPVNFYLFFKKKKLGKGLFLKSRQVSGAVNVPCVAPARFTSRPEARGSGPEAVFRFLGSGVDSRGEKGEKGRRVGSSSREFAYI